MPKARIIAPRTDAGSIAAFRRYNLAIPVIESENWDQLFSKLAQSGDAGESITLFKQFRLLNLVLLIQHIVTELLGLIYKQGEMRDANTAHSDVIYQIKNKNQLKDFSEAEQFLEQHTNSEPARVFTPRVLLYMAELTFGQIIDMLHSKTNDFGNKEIIICKLKTLNKARNMLVHRLFLGQVEADAEIDAGISAGQQAWQELNKLLEQRDPGFPR